MPNLCFASLWLIFRVFLAKYDLALPVNSPDLDGQSSQNAWHEFLESDHNGEMDLSVLSLMHSFRSKNFL